MSTEKTENIIEVVPGLPVVVGTATVRFEDKGKYRGLYVLSAADRRGRRIDIDSDRDGLIVAATRDRINAG